MSALIPRMKIYCSIVRHPVSYLEFMTEEWMGLAQTDTGLLSGLFLAASRHLSENHPQQQLFTRLAIQYKIACVRAVSETISAATLSQFRDSTVANVMVLAFDEVRSISGATPPTTANDGLLIQVFDWQSSNL
jgi:hypothetical protein